MRADEPLKDVQFPPALKMDGHIYKKTFTGLYIPLNSQVYFFIE